MLLCWLAGGQSHLCNGVQGERHSNMFSRCPVAAAGWCSAGWCWKAPACSSKSLAVPACMQYILPFRKERNYAMWWLDSGLLRATKETPNPIGIRLWLNSLGVSHPLAMQLDTHWTRGQWSWTTLQALRFCYLIKGQIYVCVSLLDTIDWLCDICKAIQYAVKVSLCLGQNKVIQTEHWLGEINLFWLKMYSLLLRFLLKIYSI